MDSKAAPPPLTEEQRNVRRRRRRLLAYTSLLLLAILAGVAVRAYFASLPRRAESRVREGIGLMSPAHYGEAVDKFNEALRLYPNRNDIFARRGLAYQNLGRIDLALEDYQRALLVDSHQPVVVTARGMIYRG